MLKIFKHLTMAGSITLILSSCLSPIAASPQIDRIIAFGDSLSDNGNLFQLTQEIHELSADVPIIPDPLLYWHGRFSDGPVWVDFLTSLLGFMPPMIEPEQRYSAHYQNYAYGGAWAEAQSSDDGKTIIDHSIPEPLSEQIEEYIANNKINHPLSYPAITAHDLVFIWVGGNDYLNQTADGLPIGRKPEKSTTQVIAAISNGVKKLIAAGNKNIVFINLPDLSRLPDIYQRDLSAHNLSPLMKETTYLHNQKLKNLAYEFSHSYKDVQFIFFDVDSVFNEEFLNAKQRALIYSAHHAGKSQDAFFPCLLEKNDPNTEFSSLLKNNYVLMTSSFSLGDKTTARAGFRQCDQHHELDQQSPFNYLQAYEAGGIFFDHIHPLTQIHITLAQHICHLLEAYHYTFYQVKSKTYARAHCDTESTMELVRRIITPPFPMAH